LNLICCKSADTLTLTLVYWMGGGVNLPPDHYFCCHFRTAWNWWTRLCDFSWIWIGYRMALSDHIWHLPGIQYGGWKTGKCLEISVNTSYLCLYYTYKLNFNAYPHIFDYARLRHASADIVRCRPTSGIQNGGHENRKWK
jgi:hypothetical protein